MGGRRPDSPETHPGGGNRLVCLAFGAVVGFTASRPGHPYMEL